jgi:hypothetical protein
VGITCTMPRLSHIGATSLKGFGSSAVVFHEDMSGNRGAGTARKLAKTRCGSSDERFLPFCEGDCATCVAVTSFRSHSRRRCVTSVSMAL